MVSMRSENPICASRCLWNCSNDHLIDNDPLSSFQGRSSSASSFHAFLVHAEEKYESVGVLSLMVTRGKVGNFQQNFKTEIMLYPFAFDVYILSLKGNAEGFLKVWTRMELEWCPVVEHARSFFRESSVPVLSCSLCYRVMTSCRPKFDWPLYCFQLSLWPFWEQHYVNIYYFWVWLEKFPSCVNKSSVK